MKNYHVMLYFLNQQNELEQGDLQEKFNNKEDAIKYMNKLIENEISNQSTVGIKNNVFIQYVVEEWDDDEFIDIIAETEIINNNKEICELRRCKDFTSRLFPKEND